MDTKQRLRTCLHENQYIVPSYSHYGGYSGFHDYGVLGIRIKNKLLNYWREFFLHQDDINEIETPVVMPYDILKASGHVDKFTDYMVTDASGRNFRADHLVKDYLRDKGDYKLAELVDSFKANQLEYYINSYNLVQKPDNKPVKVVHKNLMFEIPNSHDDKPDFLRPELAQGMFVNIKNYVQYSRDILPFGLAQIGKSYRKEINPSPFTRLREFTQAEIEYFVDPKDKNHPNYDKYKDYQIPILTSTMQMENQNKPLVTSLQDALINNQISHQTMAYFLAKIHQFALNIGLKPDKIRFRQHMDNEMAHYASECWDLETFVDNDWLECVGCADRGDYDLRVHSTPINSLKIQQRLKIPTTTKKLKLNINKKAISKEYKDLKEQILEFLDRFKDLEKMQQDLQTKGYYIIGITGNNMINQVDITNKMVDIQEKEVLIEYDDIYPHTIEPSFGIDRLLYSMFEQNFWIRENDIPNQNDKRTVISLPKLLVPYDIAIFQLHNKKDMMDIAQQVKELCKENGLHCYIDNSRVSIGKRYARLDEIGVKYAITIDPGTLQDHQVTLRERDTMKQIRIDIDDLVKTIVELN